MSFLRNAWYVIEWSERLNEVPIRRRVLGESIALYRLRNGEAVAIGDRCPHRSASLSQGKLVNDELECPYHGLRYGRDGRCVHNPYGDGTIPPGAKVKSYRIEKRHHALWVWMGDEALADPDLIPDFSLFDRPEFATSRDHLHVAADYQLVNDNLLDLSHATYMHPFLTSPGFAARSRTKTKHEGTTVWSYRWSEQEPLMPLFRLVWDRDEQFGDLRAHMRWTAPSTLLLDLGMNYPGTDAGPWLPSAHLLTPETETSTHYFWMAGRNCQQDNQELGAAIHAAAAHAFTTEDEPMIVRVSQNMAGEDFWSSRPISLVGDAAALRARRLLAGLISREKRAAQSVARGKADHDALRTHSVASPAAKT
jgi:phenylpropionate dioxygenase-like ring-hydroxylating dioxygenase large terminal subunit